MKIRMKISRLLAAVLLVPLTLTQITFPSKAEESVRKIANLIVFVDFQDTVHENKECYTVNPQIEELFGVDESDPKSLKQYIKAISYEQMEVENVIPQYNREGNQVVPVKLSMSSSQYTDGVNGDANLIEVLAQEWPEQLQLSEGQLDYDGDGVIDNLMLVLPDEPSNSNTSGRMNTYQGSASIGGKQIGNYTVIPEYDAYKSSIKKSGVIIHEFLHTLGCADLYWGGATGEEVPVGFWDMMATGDAGLLYPLAYTRSHDLGLFRIPEIRTSQTNYKIYAASAATSATKDQQAVILKTDRYADEFFVVEYRKPGTDYDSYMRGSGLVIYRVKEGRRGNMQGPPFGIYVFRQGDSMMDGHEKADYELLKSSSYFSQESGRASFGNAEASAGLSDNALTYSDGTNSGIVIKNIGSTEGDTISFDIEFTDTGDAASWRTETDTVWSGLTNPSDLASGTAPQMVNCQGGTYVAYIDTSWHARLCRWNGSAWEDLYRPSAQYVNEVALTGKEELYLVYADGDGSYAYAYSPSEKSGKTLGSSICGAEGANPSICVGDKVYAAYRSTDGNNRITVKSYDASADTWNALPDTGLQANSFCLKQYGGSLYLLKDGTTFGSNGMYLYTMDPSSSDLKWRQLGTDAITGNPASGMDLCFNGDSIYVIYYDGAQHVIKSSVWTGTAWETFCPDISVQTVSSLSTWYQDGKVYLRYVENGNAAYRSCEVTPETVKPEPEPDPVDPPKEPEQPTQPVNPPKEPEQPTQPVEPPKEPEQPTQPVDPPKEPEQPSQPEESAAPKYTANESVYGLHASVVDYRTVQLTWNRASGASGYELYYSTSPDSGYQFVKKLGKGTKFKFTKAACGTPCYFKIRSFQKVKKTMTYLEESHPVTVTTNIGQPSGLKTGKVTYDGVALKWKKVKGATSYHIYMASPEDGDYRYLTSEKKSSVTLKNLETGKQYQFKVTAVRDQFESESSGPVMATPNIGVLNGLKGKAVKAGQISLNWKKQKGVEQYVILRADSADGAYRQIGTTGRNSCMNTELESGKTYYYKVYGVRGSYQTNVCGPVSVTVK